MSSTSVKFLEVRAYKGNNRFEIIPEYKDSDIGKVLNWNSAHPNHVHTSWPKALRTRTRNLASNQQRYREALQNLVLRFRRSFAPDHQIQLIETKPMRRIGKPAVGRESKSMWVAFGFHPVLVGRLHRAIRAIVDCNFCKWLWSTAFQDARAGARECFSLRVAWYNRLPAITTLVSRHNH